MGRYKLSMLNSDETKNFQNLLQLISHKKNPIQGFRSYDLSDKFTATSNVVDSCCTVLEIWYNSPNGEEIKLFTGSKVDDHVDGWCYYGKWIHTGPWIADINQLIKKEFENPNLRSLQTQQDEQYQNQVKILKKYKS